MQVKYSIVDPLVAALALTITGSDKETDPLFLQANSVEGSSISIQHVPAREFFKKFANDSEELKRFRIFLKQIGSINMFATYVSSDSPIPSIPYLMEILNKLIYGDQSRRVITGGAISLPSLSQSHSNADANADADTGIDCKDKTALVIPFFVPHPELEVRLVSKEAYDSLCVLFELIQSDLSGMKISDKDTASWFSHLTGSLPWCACMSKAWEGDLKSKKMPQQYFVTSPKNLLLLSPHSLLVHFGLTLSPSVKIEDNVSRKFSLLIARQTESIEMIYRLLIWLSSQKKVLSSVPIMTEMYRLVCNSMKETSTVGDSYSGICDTLREGRRFLWIPDSKPKITSGQDKLPLEWGSIIPLKDVVLEDGLVFIPTGGPVTVMYDYYDKECKEVRHLFSRTNRSRTIERVCTACMVVEGMFGARGLPLMNFRMRGKQPCECVDTGFGRYDRTLHLHSMRKLSSFAKISLIS